MNDKLALLHEFAEKKGIQLSSNTDEVYLNNENKDLQEYLERVTVAQKYLNLIMSNIQKLEYLKLEFNSSIAEKEKENSKNIDFHITKSTELQQQVKIIIDMNSTFVKQSETNSLFLEQEKRIIKNLHGCLVKKFQDALTEFSTVESEIKNIYQLRTVRNAEIVLGRKLDPIERENVISEPKVRYILN